MNKLLVLTLMVAGTVLAQEEMEIARQALEKTLETQRLISKEANDWRVGKEIMQERIDLIHRECETLKERIAQTKKDREESESKLAELKARNDLLKNSTTCLQKDIKALEFRVLALMHRTPEPVRQRVAPLTQRIPSNPKETKLSLSERYQNVIGVMNELNKAAREIAVGSEVRTLKDGRQTEVTVFYIGLSQAYYVNEKSGLAGVGKLGENGGEWIWEEQNDLVVPVSTLLGIYRGEKPAAYVPLRMTVQ